MSHDYSAIARDVLQSLGGVDNVEQAAHCVTRLRLSLKDPKKVDVGTLNQIDLVKGSFFTGGLYQVVIGPGDVEKVYAALREQTGLAAMTIADLKQQSAAKINGMQRLVRILSDVFMPIPAGADHCRPADGGEQPDRRQGHVSSRGSPCWRPTRRWMACGA